MILTNFDFNDFFAYKIEYNYWLTSEICSTDSSLKENKDPDFGKYPKWLLI